MLLSPGSPSRLVQAPGTFFHVSEVLFPCFLLPVPLPCDSGPLSPVVISWAPVIHAPLSSTFSHANDDEGGTGAHNYSGWC